MKGIDRFITKITTKIVIELKGKSIGCGTGFFCSHKNYMFLVTNKHVPSIIEDLISQNKNYKDIQSQIEKYEICNRSNGCGGCDNTDKCNQEIQELEMNLQEKKDIALQSIKMYYYLYTDNGGKRMKIERICNYRDFILDEEYDLAVLDITAEFENSSYDIFYIDSSSFPTTDFVKEFISPIEDIILIGYPDGRYDDNTHIPIIYKGITSTPYSHDYKGKKIFMAQLPGIGGESGSPVFLYSKNYYSDNEDRIYGSGGQFIFLGLLWAGWTSNSRKSIIDDLEKLIDKKILDLSEDEHDTSGNEAFLKGCEFFIKNEECRELLQTSIHLCEIIKADIVIQLLEHTVQSYGDQNSLGESDIDIFDFEDGMFLEME